MATVAPCWKSSPISRSLMVSGSRSKAPDSRGTLSTVRKNASPNTSWSNCGFSMITPVRLSWLVVISIIMLHLRYFC